MQGRCYIDLPGTGRCIKVMYSEVGHDVAEQPTKGCYLPLSTFSNLHS
jgi:hypothetical protein